MSNILILNLPFLIRKPNSGHISKFFWSLIFISILFLVVFCVFQINAYIKDIYSIQNYEIKLKKLTEEQKILEIDFSKLHSLNNLSNYIQNFEKTNKIEYIRVLEGTAMAK